MASTIQTIETPKRARALDTSTGWQIVGTELVSEGGFTGADDDDPWDTTSGWAIASNKATCSSGNDNLSQTLSIIAGRKYRVSVDVTRTSGTLNIDLGSATAQTTTSSGVQTFDFVAINTNDLRFYGGAFRGDLEDVSVKEIQYFPNNNHGQIYSGRALEFDGVTDYFQHNGGAGITGTSLFADGVPWTFACWMYFDSASTSENFFVGNDGQTQPHITFKNSSDDNILRFRDTNADYYTFSTTKLDNNTWYRIVITTDGTSMTAYVNGVVYGTIAANQANVAADDNFDNTLMEFSGWGSPYESGGTRNQHLQGMMSNGQVWDTAWTADDASYDYLNPESLALNRGGTSLTNSNLKAWYPMQDGHRGQQSYILDASNTGLGADLITSGDFEGVSLAAGNQTASSATGQWRCESADSDNWLITDGYATLTGSLGGTRYLRQSDVFSIPPDEGAAQTYKMVVTISDYVSGEVKFNPGGYEAGVAISGNGTHTVYHKPTHTSSNKHLYIQSAAASPLVGKIDNVEVYKVNTKNNATTVFHGDNLLAGVSGAADGDWEDSGNTPTFTAVYDGGSGSGITYDPDNTSSPLTGSKDAKVTNAAGESAGIISNAITLVTGRTYRLKYNYLTNYNASSQTNPLYVKIGETSATDSANIDTAGGYAQATLQATSKTAVSLEFTHTDSDTEVFLVFFGGNGLVFQIDDLSLAEVGTATGWTDADQQLYIPQTALQSYNELAWFQDNLGTNNPHAAVAHHTDLDPGTDDFTASCWVFQSDVHDDNYVFAKGGGGGSGWNFQLSSTNNIIFAVEDDDGSNDGTRLTISKSGIPLGEWFHLVATYEYGSATGLNLYLNGESIATAVDVSSHNNPIRNTASVLKMGSWTASYAAGVMNGSATEFSIFYDVAFSAAEVNELYNDGKALDATTHSQVANLKGYWRNDGLNTTWKNIVSANSLNSQSPGDHDATFSNGAETILIPSGVDGSRDSQGFLMNRQRNTSSLNTVVSGTGYVNIPVKGDDGLAFIGVGDAFSISAWIKVRTAADSSLLILSRNDNTDGYRLEYRSNEKLAFLIEENDNDISAVTDSAISLDTWYHVVGTFDGDPSDNGSGVVNLYLDGVTGSSTTTNATNSNDMDAAIDTMSIGQHAGEGGYFPGEIDGVLIYDDVLTQAEVTRNYNATKGSHRN